MSFLISNVFLTCNSRLGSYLDLGNTPYCNVLQIKNCVLLGDRLTSSHIIRLEIAQFSKIMYLANVIYCVKICFK